MRGQREPIRITGRIKNNDYVMKGGKIDLKDAFRNILSIGYEFETHDLAKLSLADDGSMINTNTMLRNLKQKLGEGTAEKVDEHSYEMMEESGLFFREYFDEPDVSSGKDSEGKYNVVMHITNDRSSTQFTKMLTNKCSQDEDDVSKDDLYVFKTKDGKEYPIHFSGEMLEAGCGEMTGTEYVMTFYNPKKSGNIILETFLHATKLMIDHLDNLLEISGALYFKGEEKAVGSLEERFLYNKPGTNLYYLETHQIEDTDTEMMLDKVGFVPQMTFRVHIEELLPVLRAILFENDFARLSSKKKEIMDDYKELVRVEEWVSALLEDYNAGAGEMKIPLEEPEGKTIFGYLFMIFYKIYMYSLNYRSIKTGEDGSSELYFKDFLSFASRHSNYVFYRKIKTLLRKLFPSFKGAASLVLKIIDRPDITSKYLKSRSGKEVPGDPSYSVVSYFLFFENPSETKGGMDRKEKEKGVVVVKESDDESDDESDEEGGDEERDWFVSSGLDVYTTLFDLPLDGSILLENRVFYKELSAYADSMVRNASFDSYPSIRNYKRFYNVMMKRGKERKSGDKVWNPLTRRFVQKCKPGYARTTKFKCRFSRRLKKCGVGKEMNMKTKRCRKIKTTSVHLLKNPS